MPNRPQSFVFNGINGATGEYFTPSMTADQASRLALGSFESGEAQLGVTEGADPRNLSESGWGVLFAHGEDATPLKKALHELLELRREQAGDLYQELSVLAGESKSQFLDRHQAQPGPVDPRKLPYYILIVADPQAVPFHFQRQMALQFAVGRIHFDRLDDYARYARSVVEAEAGQLALPRRAAFFAPRNPDDPSTQLSCQHLAQPLADHAALHESGWRQQSLLGQKATKAELVRLLHGEAAPALLFTAGHGLAFPKGHPGQLAHQGALLCQDWPGPIQWKGEGAIPRDFFLSAQDVPSDAQVKGLLSFHFASFSAATPHYDCLAEPGYKRSEIAPIGFAAALPKRLLSHPKGGALAYVGQAGRGWGFSNPWDSQDQLAVFEGTLRRLLQGHPVGSAMECFKQRHAELSRMLAQRLRDMEGDDRPDQQEVAGLWTAYQDARSYLIMGDPAVRLALDSASKMALPEDDDAVGSGQPPPRHFKSPGTGSGSQAPRSAREAPYSVREEAEAAAQDEVRFSACHPRAVTPQSWHKLLVYAHLHSASAQIKADAGQILGEAAQEYRQAEADASMPVAAGTEITLVPQAQNLEFQPPQARIFWSGSWQRADFELRASEEGAGQAIEGSVACYAGPLLIADIPLKVVVASTEGEPAEPSPPQVQSVKIYQAVFASYSHSDRAIVEAVEKAYKALGLDYFRDVMTLRSGQTWSEELLDLIDRADIFQLFWSQAASQSIYVEKEWRHALALLDSKAPAFIRPIYWAEPMPAVPQPLSSIHFALVDFTGLGLSGGAAGAITVGPPLPALAALTPQAGQDLTTLTVSTYAAADPSNPGHRVLKARSHVSLLGEATTTLPEGLAAEDQGYLEVHQALVREALKARLEYLRIIAGMKRDDS